MLTSIELKVTEAAAKRIKQLLEDNNMPEGYLRVFVMPGGCAGFQYGMTLTDKPEEDDVVVRVNGVQIVVDPFSAELLNGAEIDFVDDIMRSSFVINNPNAMQSCSCGTSFKAQGRDGAPGPCCGF